MQSTEVHKVIVSRDNFDILSADTGFYAFMGERLYYTFNRFVAAQDREMFDGHFRRCSREHFFLRLINVNGQNEYFFARITEGTSKDNCVVELIQVEDLVESEKRLRKDIVSKNAILELYNDAYFEYSPAENRVRLYTAGKSAQDDVYCTLDKLEEHMVFCAGEEDLEGIHQMIRDIASGTRNFGLDASRDLLNNDPNIAATSIRGKSIYENGELSGVVGYFHFGVSVNQNGRKKLELDSLTGVLSKAEITNLATNIIDVRKISDITIAIVDVDFFKKVNDTYGHMRGDEVLRKVAGIMEKEVGDDGVVGRIGGDEFFIIFYHAGNMENMRERLRSIKNMVNASFPKNNEGRPSITLSIGCSAYPKDADNYGDLFQLADFALYRAKEKGRNRYIIYDKEKHGTLEQIKKMKMTGNRIDNRGDMSPGDIVCAMADKVYGVEDYSLQRYLDDIVVNFGIQRIMVYAGTPYKVVVMAGEKRPSKELLNETQDYVSDSAYQKLFGASDTLLIENVQYIEGRHPGAYSSLMKQEVLSYIQIKFRDKSGKPCILSLESVSRRITWNHSYMTYYRLLARALSEYSIEEI